MAFIVIVTFTEDNNGVKLAQPHQEMSIGFNTFEEAQTAFNLAYVPVCDFEKTRK